MSSIVPSRRTPSWTLAPTIFMPFTVPLPTSPPVTPLSKIPYSSLAAAVTPSAARPMWLQMIVACVASSARSAVPLKLPIVSALTNTPPAPLSTKPSAPTPALLPSITTRSERSVIAPAASRVVPQLAPFCVWPSSAV